MEAILKKEIVLSKTTCRMIGVCIFVALTALGAFVRVPLPFTPVPLTLQTIFVLLSGAFLGNRLAIISQLSYILLGVTGLPIFTGAGSGLLYIAGPTGGYLFGFMAAALITGGLMRSGGKSKVIIFAIFCLADLMLLLCGAAWLKFSLNLSFGKSIFIGVIPFIAGDTLKALAATFIYSGLKNRTREIF
jgi:biotin transport system substrate-specific component